MIAMFGKCLLLVSCFISIQTSIAVNYSVSTSKEPCQLAFEEDEYNGSKKMVRIDQVLYITIKLTNSSHMPDSLDQNSDLFHAREWIRISGTRGKRILQLRPNYKIMSLNMLSHNTHHVELRLQTIPQGCMKQFNVTEYELFLRQFLLNHTKDDDEICNVHVGNNSGYAEFYPECCGYDERKEMKCHQVEKNPWMAAIDYFTYLVIVLVVLYCPFIIPSSLYNPELAYKPYEHIPDKQFTFTVKKTTSEQWKQNGGNNKSIETSKKPVSFQLFRKMKKFKSTLGRLHNDKVYNIKVSKIQFRVGSDELVSAEHVPTGFFKACYDAIIQGGLRGQKEMKSCCNDAIIQGGLRGQKEMKSCCNDAIIQDGLRGQKEMRYCNDAMIHGGLRGQKKMKSCCYANIFGSSQTVYPWYKCWRSFMGILLSLAVCTPWIIRVALFYGYENSIRETRQIAAESRNLKIELENNLVYYVTPFHVFFIVCYVLVLGAYFVLGVLSMVLFRDITALVQDIVQPCLVDIYMSDDSTGKVFQWAKVALSKPLTKYGIFGLLFVIFYWVLMVPVVALVFAYYFFPTVYLTVSFVSFFFSIFTNSYSTRDLWRKKFWEMNERMNDPFCFEMLKPCEPQETNDNSNHKKNVNNCCREFWRIVLTITFLIMVMSFFIISIECIIFLIEVSVYTMIGVIVNSSHAMQYISTFSLAYLYYNTCFGGISKIFLKYNKAVLAILYRENKKQIDRVLREDYENMKNTAFKTALKSGDQYQKVEMRTDFGIPKLKTNQVILLLDRHDKQYITKKFFFEICKIPDGPGPLVDHIKKAVRRFLTIGIFLVFVTIVVLAFGESYSISISNQLLASFAGGVVPLILIKAKVLFSEPEIDEEELVKKYFYDEDEDYSSKSGDPDLEGAYVTRLDRFRKKFHKIIKNDEKWWNIQDLEVVVEKCIGEINTAGIDLIVLEGKKTIEKSEENLLNGNKKEIQSLEWKKKEIQSLEWKKKEIPENNEKNNIASGSHVNDICVFMKGL